MKLDIIRNKIVTKEQLANNLSIQKFKEKKINSLLYFFLLVMDLILMIIKQIIYFVNF